MPVFWEAAAIQHPALKIDDVAKFFAEMERAGMPLPCVVGREDIPALEALARVAGDERNPYHQILTAILLCGPIWLREGDASGHKQSLSGQLR